MASKTKPRQHFPLGRVNYSGAALKRIPVKIRTRAVEEHAAGNWGDVSERIVMLNFDSVRTRKGKVLSRRTHRNKNGAQQAFWVCTDFDRGQTCVSLAKNSSQKETRKYNQVSQGWFGNGQRYLPYSVRMDRTRFFYMLCFTLGVYVNRILEWVGHMIWH